MTDNYNAWVGSACECQATFLMFILLTWLLSFVKIAASNSAPAPPPAPSQTTTSTPAPSSTSSGFAYVHCYQDDSARILPQSSDSNNLQTIDKCLAKCASGGYAYAGVEYGQECFCASTLRSNAVQAPEGDCAMPCPGDGGFCYLSVLLIFLNWQF